MDPKALVELKRIKDDTANEVEQNEMALKLCMKYMIENSKEDYEQFRDRFEFRNRGSGYDFYLKRSHVEEGLGPPLPPSYVAQIEFMFLMLLAR